MTKCRQIRRFWSKSDDKFLKSHYHFGAQICACGLNRSLCSIYGRANLLGLNGTFYKRFNEKEIQFVRDNYGSMSNKEIGNLIGRTRDSIKALAEDLDIHRTAEQSKTIMNRCSAKTRFVKGHLPKNTKSDFEITIRTSHCGLNYKWIRLSVANWVMLHVYNWEQVNGPVPIGKILRSISVDSLDCSPENWKLVDRAEHLDQNNGRSTLEDKYIANILTIKDKSMKPVYMQMPELLELKRNQLKLRRTINELT